MATQPKLPTRETKTEYSDNGDGTTTITTTTIETRTTNTDALKAQLQRKLDALNDRNAAAADEIKKQLDSLK